MSLRNRIARHILHPLLDIKEGSSRLRVLRQLEQSQWLPEAELRALQWQRLRAIVAYVGENCAYYQKLFRDSGFNARDFVLSDFRRLPMLRKAEIRAHTDDLISREFPRADLRFHKTGGSTGVSLTTYFDRQWLHTRTADAMRANQWAGGYHGMKTAAIWGNPQYPTTLKGRIRARLLERAIYLDTMNLNAETMMQFIEKWRVEKPEILFGHSHSLFMFARFVATNGITDLRPRGIISTSMMLLSNEREVIEAAFACKVTDRYGCEEVGLIACECERHAGLHLNIEHLYIEFCKPDGREARPGEEGVILLTDLLNKGMPLIRYRVEDAGVPTDRRCPCGRGMPLMERVVGRVADYLKRADGSLVAGVSLVERTLTAIEGIEQMQIVQEELGRIVLKLVLTPEFGPVARSALLEEFYSVFGRDMHIDIEPVRTIPQERSGKYRFSICKV